MFRKLECVALREWLTATLPHLRSVASHGILDMSVHSRPVESNSQTIEMNWQRLPVHILTAPQGCNDPVQFGNQL